MYKYLITLIVLISHLSSFAQVKIKCATLQELEQMKTSLLEDADFESLIPIQEEIKQRTESKEKIDNAEIKIKSAVELEDFALAASLKKEISQLKRNEEQRIKNCAEYHVAITNGDYEKALVLKNKIEKNAPDKITKDKSSMEITKSNPANSNLSKTDSIDRELQNKWKKLNGVRFGFSSEFGAAQFVTREDFITTESTYRVAATFGPTARLRFGKKNGFGMYLGTNIGYFLDSDVDIENIWYLEIQALFRYDIGNKFNVFIGPQVHNILNANFYGNNPISLKIGVGHKNTNFCYSMGLTPLYESSDPFSSSVSGGFVNTFTIKAYGIFEK